MLKPTIITTRAVILNRRNLKEADRLITLFTPEYGKLTALASGVRKISSRRSAGLDIATYSRVQLRKTNQYSIITQVMPITNFPLARTSLVRLTQVVQLLEIIDHLTLEDQEYTDVFDVLISTLEHLESSHPQKHRLLSNIRTMLKHLGYLPDQEMPEHNLKTYIESITDRPLRSKQFLFATIPA